MRRVVVIGVTHQYFGYDPMLGLGWMSNRSYFSS